MPLLLVALLLLLVVVGMSFAFHLLGLLLMLIMAGLIGALADAVVPGRLPGGWLARP